MNVIEIIINNFFDAYEKRKYYHYSWSQNGLHISINDKEYEADDINNKAVCYESIKQTKNNTISKINFSEVFLTDDEQYSKLKAKEDCDNFNDLSKYWTVEFDIDIIDKNKTLIVFHYALKKSITIIKGDDKMNKKLSKEAIDEIVGLLKEVKEVVSLLKDMGIRITSDPWEATSFDSSENILVWKREDFEKINEDISDGDIFYIGGNVITGGEHRYKNKWIIAPKELAEVQGKIFEKYLQSIVNSTSLKYFNLELKNPYGLTDNCGWENWFVIETTVKDSALISSQTEKLLQQILNEEDYVIELSASPIYKKPKNEFPKETGLQPQGDFAYMIEFFSTSLVCQDDDDYIGCFSAHDYNGKYIRDAMALINDVEKRAKELENKYSDKGVKVTVNDFNEGCQYGMAIYVWIPYQ